MLDISYLALSPHNNTQMFNASNGTDWFVWNRPRGRSMAFMIAISSGGGGGGGQSATNANGAGGAGGASGTTAQLIVPIALLPDRLYIQAALGGIGGPADTIGNAGNPSYISQNLGSTAAADLWLYSGAGGTAGGAGVAGTGGAGGGAPTIATNTNAILSTLGNWATSNGVAGSGGGNSNTTGNNLNALATTFLTGGAGGGGQTSGSDKPGGAINSVLFFPGIPTGGVGGGAGNNGIILNGPLLPYCACGGTGGGSKNASGVGGAGGNGALGSGGGGGGAGATAGAGGNGGAGMVMIVCW